MATELRKGIVLEETRARIDELFNILMVESETYVEDNTKIADKAHSIDTGNLTSDIENVLLELGPEALGIPTTEDDMFEKFKEVTGLSDLQKQAEDEVGGALNKLPGQIPTSLGDLGDFAPNANADWVVALTGSDFNASGILENAKSILGDGSLFKQLSGLNDMFMDRLSDVANTALTTTDMVGSIADMVETPIIQDFDNFSKKVENSGKSIEEFDQLLTKLDWWGGAAVADEIDGYIEFLEQVTTNLSIDDESYKANINKFSDDNNLDSALKDNLSKYKDTFDVVLEDAQQLLSSMPGNILDDTIETTPFFENIKNAIPSLPNIEIPSSLKDAIPQLNYIMDPAKMTMDNLATGLESIPNLADKIPNAGDLVSNALKELNISSIGLGGDAGGTVPPVFTQAADFLVAPSNIPDLVSNLKTLIPTVPEYLSPEKLADKLSSGVDSLLDSATNPSDLLNTVTGDLTKSVKDLAGNFTDKSGLSSVASLAGALSQVSDNVSNMLTPINKFIQSGASIVNMFGQESSNPKPSKLGINDEQWIKEDAQIGDSWVSGDATAAEIEKDPLMDHVEIIFECIDNMANKNIFEKLKDKYTERFKEAYKEYKTTRWGTTNITFFVRALDIYESWNNKPVFDTLMQVYLIRKNFETTALFTDPTVTYEKLTEERMEFMLDYAMEKMISKAIEEISYRDIENTLEIDWTRTS